MTSQALHILNRSGSSESYLDEVKASVYNSYGLLLRAMNRMDRSLAMFKMAHELKPSYKSTDGMAMAKLWLGPFLLWLFSCTVSVNACKIFFFFSRTFPNIKRCPQVIKKEKYTTAHVQARKRQHVIFGPKQ